MSPEHDKEVGPDAIEMPTSAGWPMILAFGLTLLAAGLVTHFMVSVVGLLLSMRAAVGWFKEIFPIEAHEYVPLVEKSLRAHAIKASSRSVMQLTPGVGSHRVRIPAEIHPYSSGFKGGLAGGVAMAMVACLYGLISEGSIWYPFNLLAAAALPAMADAELAQLKAFNGTAFIVGLISHIVFSSLVGLLFAVLLPMLPTRRAAFWASFITPIMWTALIWASLDAVNPALNARINWRWFIASQIAFGMVCGYIVHHSKMVETMQTWPLAARAGLEVPGVMEEKEEE